MPRSHPIRVGQETDMRRTSSDFIPQRDLKDPGKMKSRHVTLTCPIATFAGHVARAHVGLLPPAVALLPCPPKRCSTRSSASSPSCAASAAVSPAGSNGREYEYCMTNYAVLEVTGREIQTRRLVVAFSRVDSHSSAFSVPFGESLIRVSEQ